MDTHVLVLIPMKPDLHPELAQKSMRFAASLSKKNVLYDVVVDRRSFDGTGGGHTERQAGMTGLRNAVLNENLRSWHSHVLWMDADIAEMPAGLLDSLLDLSPTDVVAPAVLYDVKRQRRGRWYDIAGFVQNGRRARVNYPWFDTPGPVHELESVGTLYLVPAEVYREGGRHAVTQWSEHYSVCQFAKSLGMKVLCDERLRVFHANLPTYEGGAD